MVTGAPRLERWSNDGSTTINDAGGISAGDTSVTVTSGASFPSVADFRVVIGSEIILVTAVSGTTWTIERGQEGTTAAAHSDGAGVFLYLTNGSIDRAFQDGFAEPDYPLNRILDKGTTRDESFFTWLNQGTATSATADDGGIKMTCPNDATFNWRGKYMTAPATPYKVVTYCMLGHGFNDGNTATTASAMGPFFREASTGKLYLFLLRGDAFTMQRYTNTTTFSANVDSYTQNNRHRAWLMLEDDGTDVKGSISMDGYVWEECFNEGRTSFMTGGVGPDQVGFGVSSGNAIAGAEFFFKSWILE